MDGNSRTHGDHVGGPLVQVFYASIHALGGRLVGHVPICGGVAGAFEPIPSPDGEWLDALAMDRGRSSI